MDPDDPLAFVGLGLGATQRARDLVLKGLEFERQEELKAFQRARDLVLKRLEFERQEELKAFIESEISRLDAECAALAEKRADLDELLGAQTGGRGRPSKGWLTIDVKRAAAVLSVDDIYRNKKGKSFSRQIDAINSAIKIEKVLFERGLLEDRLFDPMTTIKRFQDSVSAGLQELPEHSGRFLK